MNKIETVTSVGFSFLMKDSTVCNFMQGSGDKEDTNGNCYDG